MIKCQKQIKASQVIEFLAHAPKTSMCLALRDSMKSNNTEKKLHPESYFWSFSTLVPGIIKRWKIIIMFYSVFSLSAAHIGSF